MALEQARQKVSDSLKQYTDLASNQSSVVDTLKQKVMAAYDNNQDIVKPLDQSTAEYYQAPATAREKYQDIFNPFTREKLVSQYTTNSALPMQALANIYGNRMGRIEDTIGQGVDAYKSQITAAQGAYTGAQQDYENQLKEYELNQKYAPENDIMAQLSSLLLGTGQQPTEAQPLYEPYQKDAKSEGGQWQWNGKQWVPTNNAGGLGGDDKKKALSAAILSGDLSAAGANAVASLMGISKPTDQMTSESLVRQLSGLKGLVGTINPLTAGLSNIPGVGTAFSDTGFNTFKTTRDLLAQTVAKMFESGRLSDQDRLFYIRNFPTDTEAIFNPTKAQDKVESVVSYFKNAHPEWFGSSGGESSGIDSGFNPSDWEVM